MYAWLGAVQESLVQAQLSPRCYFPVALFPLASGRLRRRLPSSLVPRSSVQRAAPLWLAGDALVSSLIMLTIPRALYDKIVAHARADHPDEACGVLAGPAGSDRPERFIAMMNAERSPTFYRFDSAEQFRVWREMDDRDEEPVVIYHSHTATEAYPSRTDISYASEPQAHYVLVSTRDEEQTEFRSYRIVGRRGHRGAGLRGGMIRADGRVGRQGLTR